MFLAKLTDRFDIKMSGVTVTVAPLSGRDKIMISSFTSYEKGKLKIDKPSQEHYIIKKSVKAIQGILLADGTEYTLEFENGQDSLTDLCADEVLGFLSSTWFSVAGIQLAEGKLGEVINPITGKAIEGMSIDLKGASKQESKDEEVTEKK